MKILTTMEEEKHLREVLRRLPPKQQRKMLKEIKQKGYKEVMHHFEKKERGI